MPHRDIAGFEGAVRIQRRLVQVQFVAGGNGPDTPDLLAGEDTEMRPSGDEIADAADAPAERDPGEVRYAGWS